MMKRFCFSFECHGNRLTINPKPMVAVVFGYVTDPSV